MVGLVTGKALAHAAGKPLVAINHLEGHALSPRLSDADLDFPYLLLLVSGGHCQLLLVEGVARYRRLATTIDDAAGEAFDKVAKLLDLGFPGGPAVERAAREGDSGAVPLPRPLVGSGEPHFSFAGLKGAVGRVAADHSPQDVAASFQAAVIDCLVDRTWLALREVGTVHRAGGRRRSRGQHGGPRRAGGAGRGPTRPFRGTAGMAVHRQCRDDRLGRRRALRRRTDGFPRYRRTAALAARPGRRGRCAARE